MSMVHELINVTTSGGDVTSSTIYPQRHDDESGVYQITATAGTITTVQIFGRLGENHAWHQLVTSGAINASGGNQTASATITIYPQMYVFLDVNSSPSCVVSIME